MSVNNYKSFDAYLDVRAAFLDISIALDNVWCGGKKKNGNIGDSFLKILQAKRCIN